MFRPLEETMIRRYIATFMTVLLPLALVIQACGKSESPTPIGGGDGTTTIGQQFTTDVCAASGDKDSDGDGICDSVEALDPELGPECVEKADCNGNGTSDPNEDENFWDSNLNRALVVMASAGLGYTSRSCINGANGCDWWGPMGTQTPEQLKALPAVSSGDGNRIIIAASAASQTEAAGSVDIPFSQYVTSRIKIGAPKVMSLYVKATAAQGAYRFVTTGNTYDVGSSIYVCIRSNATVGSVNSSLEGDFQLEGDFRESLILGSSNIDNFEGDCFKNSYPGAWIGYQAASQPEGALEIHALSPVGFGFVKKSSTEHMTPASKITFKDLMDDKLSPSFFFTNGGKNLTKDYIFKNDDPTTYVKNTREHCKTISDNLGKNNCMVQGLMGVKQGGQSIPSLNSIFYDMK